MLLAAAADRDDDIADNVSTALITVRTVSPTTVARGPCDLYGGAVNSVPV